MHVLSRMTARARARFSRHQPPRPVNHRVRPFLECLEAREMLHSNAVMSAEHLAVFGSRDPQSHVITGGLVPDVAVTNRSLASGNWSNPAIWSNGVPSNGDNVLISEGTVVTIDGNASLNASNQRVALRTIRDDGTLRFATHANTTLLVDTIIVEPNGIFEMGTEADPIAPGYQAKVIFANRAQALDAAFAQAAPGTPAFSAAQAALNDYEAQRRTWDPLQFSLGFVSHGEVSINGTPVESWLQAGVDSSSNPLELKKGATTINLGSDANGNPIPVPDNWKIGDHVLIPGTQAALPYYLGGAIDASDEVTITGISKTTLPGGSVVNGTSFTIGTPLQYDHLYGSFYAANVSRNAVFQSEAPGIVARRGHIMFMHSHDVDVSHAGFYGLGRTDKRRPIDDPVLVADTDNPGQMTTDVLLANPNPALAGKTITLSDGTVLIDGKIYQNNDPTGPVLRHLERRVLAQIPDPATGKVLLQIGRTGLNPRGRYAVHYHRTGDAEPTTITGSAVVDSPGWGIVNHSSNVDVEDNVVFNVVGAAYVTEAGDEVGTFNHNIAIKSLGSGEDVRSRKAIGDFGHDGSGFWFQGGNVTVTNNVVSGQRHAGFVFVPEGLNQKGLGVTQIHGHDLPASYGANPDLMYDVADVPLLKFQGNTAFGVQVGYESWFSLLHTKLNVRTVLEDFNVFATTASAVFTPYTNRNTLRNVTARDPVNWAGVKTPTPMVTAFERNDVTANFIYDHVQATGFAVGINAPVNGLNTIVGGKFNNLKNILVTTTNNDTRVLDINDAGPGDPIHFVNSLTTLVNGQVKPLKQYDIYLQANWQPLHNDITRNFARDIVRIGLVSHNGQQVYFKEQACDFVPYPDANWIATHPGVPHGPVAAAWVPAALRNQTNQQLWDTYGLAIGGVVAPQNAVPDPFINGIVGPATQYPPPNYLFSAKWFDTRKAAYYLTYSYWNPGLNQGQGGYVYVSENSPTSLVGGWNVIQRFFAYANGGQIVAKPVSFLVYNEIQDPAFVQANPGTVLNLADVKNGTTFNLVGWIVTSYGQMQFTATIKLNDPKYVSALKTRANGTQFVTISFTIQNFAGTTTKISIDFDVTTTAPLIKDIGQLYLPYIDLSITLKKLLGLP